MRPKQERVHTIGFSLASKLNIQLWVRLIGTFVALNLLFLSVSAVALFVIGERAALRAVHFLQDADAPVLETGQLVDLNGVEIKARRAEGKGGAIPAGFRRAFPPETRSALRSVELPHREDESFYHFFDQLQYRFDLDVDQARYTVIVHYAQFIWVLKVIFLVLLAAQTIEAFKAIFTRARLIRKLLQPISDLAQQAQSLSREKGPLSMGEMEALAGTLDEINAARLDTRIDLDMTQDELKNVAGAINSLLDRINDSYRLQARFVSDASHELRTPIAAIQGYVNLLDRWGKNDPEALQESIDAIKEEADNMKDLVEQLLFLARSDNYTMQMELEHFDLSTLAQTIHRETEMIDSEHVFQVETEEIWILADQGLIKQAARILVDNAIKYTPKGEEISLKVFRREDQAWLTVQDSGIGIPPQDIPHIFDRFYRADDSRARATGGTGLGLSIAKWIVERHGGYLEVLSREEIGSRISLVLPVGGAD